MYKTTNHDKIKNGKITRWRMELLSSLANGTWFDFVNRSGKLNNVPDALSRNYVANIHDSTLRQ